MPDLQINVVTKADTRGLDEVKAKLTGVTDSVAKQLAAAGATFDPASGIFRSAAKDVENIGFNATFAGASLYKARGEALTLARELATGSYNARTLGALLGSFGSAFTVAAVAGFGLWSLIKGARDDFVKITEEEKKSTDELDNQVGKWTELAKAASDFRDVVKFEEDLIAALDKAATVFDQVEKKTLTIRQRIVDAFTTPRSSFDIFPVKDVDQGPEQKALDAEKKAFQDLFQTRLEQNVALDEAAKRTLADWERIQAGPPSAGIVELTQRIAGLNEQLAILEPKHLPPLGASPAELQAAKAAQEETAKLNAEKVVLLKHLDEETKAQNKLDQQATRSTEVAQRREINDLLKTEANTLQNIRQQQDLIKSNPYLSIQAQQELLHNLALREQATIYVEIQKDLKEIEKLKKIGDPKDTAEIARLTGEVQKLDTEWKKLGFTIQTSTFGGGLQADLTKWANSFGTASQQVANFMTGTLNTAIGSTSQALTGLIFGTKTWQQAFAQAAQSIVQNLIQIALQYVISKLVMAAIDKLTGGASSQSASQAATQAAAAWAPAAELAAIASYGAAVPIGTAAVVAGLAITEAAAIGISAAGGYAGGGRGSYEKGGYTGGRRGKIAGAVHGEEFVFDDETTRILGVPFLSALAAAAGGRMHGGGWVEPIDFPPADMSPGEFGTQAPSRGYNEPGGQPTVQIFTDPFGGSFGDYIPGGGPTVQTPTDPFGGSFGGSIPSGYPIPGWNIPFGIDPGWVQNATSSGGGGWWGSGGTRTYYPSQSGYTVLPGGSISSVGLGGPIDTSYFQNAGHGSIVGPHGSHWARASEHGADLRVAVHRHSGGPIGPDERLIIGKLGEFMMPDWTVSHYGLPAMESLRQLRVPRSALTMHEGGAVGAAGLSAGAGVTVLVANFTDMDKLHKFLLSSDAGKKIIVDTVSGAAIELGIAR